MASARLAVHVNNTKRWRINFLIEEFMSLTYLITSNNPCSPSLHYLLPWSSIYFSSSTIFAGCKQAALPPLALSTAWQVQMRMHLEEQKHGAINFHVDKFVTAPSPDPDPEPPVEKDCAQPSQQCSSRRHWGWVTIQVSCWLCVESQSSAEPRASGWSRAQNSLDNTMITPRKQRKPASQEKAARREKKTLTLV